MSKTILYGRLGTGSAVCEAILALTGHAFELKHVEKGPNGTHQQELRALNPLGQVPVLQTADGTLMTESAAIVLWLADLYPHAKLAPAIDDPSRAKYLRAMIFMATNCYMSALRYYYGERYSMNSDHADDITKKAREQMDHEFSVMADFLGTQDFILGEKICAADIYLSMLVSWEDRSRFATQFPTLAEHNKRVCAHEIISEIWTNHGFLV